MSDAKDGLLTAGTIAKEIGVSDTKVKKVIKDLALEPVMKKGVCSYYGRDALDLIKAKLKGKRWPPTTLSGWREPV